MLVLVKFSYFLKPSFSTLSPLLVVTPNQQQKKTKKTNKKKIHVWMQNFMLSILKKKIIWKSWLFWKLGCPLRLLVRFAPFRKIGPKLPPGASPRGPQKISPILRHPNFSIVAGSTFFNFWVIVIIKFTFLKPPFSWPHEPIGPNLGFFRAISPVNKARFG